MKTCKVHPLLYGTVSLLTVLLLSLFIGLTGQLLLTGAGGAALLGSERGLLIPLLALLLGLTAALGRRLLTLGQMYLEYDEIQVIFHFSNWETRAVPWKDLAGPGAGVHRWNHLPAVTFRRIPLWGWLAEFRIDGRQLPITWAASGYRDFIRTLREKGGIP